MVDILLVTVNRVVTKQVAAANQTAMKSLAAGAATLIAEHDCFGMISENFFVKLVKRNQLYAKPGAYFWDQQSKRAKNVQRFLAKAGAANRRSNTRWLSSEMPVAEAENPAIAGFSWLHGFA